MGEFAKASATVLIDPENDQMRCAVGALGRQPRVLPDARALIEGGLTPRDALQQALANRPIEELALHVTALGRALEQAASMEVATS